MDALDRTFRHLVQTIQARYPAYLAQPFEVAELYQNILPFARSAASHSSNVEATTPFEDDCSRAARTAR